MGNPCLRCGACCAHFRVSFYWSEAEPFLGGVVPVELTDKLNHQYSVMRGTTRKPARCVALDGEVGCQTSCSIYEQRPSPCRDLQPWEDDGQPTQHCSKARMAHGLPPLDPVTDTPLAPLPEWPQTA